jgi:hypothetical protein
MLTYAVRMLTDAMRMLTMQVCAEHPLPDLSALGYRNYTGNLQGLMQETQVP